MTDPVSGEAAAQAVEQLSPETDVLDGVDGAGDGADFSEVMESSQEGDVDGVDETMEVDAPQEGQSVEEVGEIPTEDFIQQLLEQEEHVEEMMERCLDGGTMEQEEMLQMQAAIYSYSQRVDVTTKVVDSATSGVEQVMNTQV